MQSGELGLANWDCELGSPLTCFAFPVQPDLEIPVSYYNPLAIPPAPMLRQKVASSASQICPANLSPYRPDWRATLRRSPPFRCFLTPAFNNFLQTPPSALLLSWSKELLARQDAADGIHVRPTRGG